MPLDEDAVRIAARDFKARVGAVAVCYLNSFVHPAHEERDEILREELPSALVSISTDVLRVFREYDASRRC